MNGHLVGGMTIEDVREMVACPECQPVASKSKSKTKVKATGVIPAEYSAILEAFILDPPCLYAGCTVEYSTDYVASKLQELMARDLSLAEVGNINLDLGKSKYTYYHVHMRAYLAKLLPPSVHACICENNGDWCSVSSKQFLAVVLDFGFVLGSHKEGKQ